MKDLNVINCIDAGNAALKCIVGHSSQVNKSRGIQIITLRSDDSEIVGDDSVNYWHRKNCYILWL
jgi:hypothetical protein